MDMRNREKDTATDTMTGTSTDVIDAFRFRVVSRSFVPAMFEWCGCHVPIGRLGLVCFDDAPTPASSGDVIEIELINGKLRHVSQSSMPIGQPSSTKPLFVDASLCRRRHQTGPLEPMVERDWVTYIRPAKDCSEQNVELIIDDCATSSNILGRTKDIDVPCASAAGFQCPFRLRTVREVRPGDELTLWYGDHLGRLMGVPLLSSLNIRGAQCYACSFCSRSFHHPNPLKSHMMYNCQASAINQSASYKSLAFSSLDMTSRDQLLPLQLHFGTSRVPSRSQSTDDNSMSETTNSDYLQRAEGSLHTDALHAAGMITRHGDQRKTLEAGQMDSTLSSSTSGIDECRRWLTGRFFDAQAARSGAVDHRNLPLHVWRNFEDEVLPMWLESSRHIDYGSAFTKECGGFSSPDAYIKSSFKTETNNLINWRLFDQSIRHISEGESIRHKDTTHGPIAWTQDRIWTRTQSSCSEDASNRHLLEHQKRERVDPRGYRNSWQNADNNAAETLRRSSSSSFSSSSASSSSSSPTTTSTTPIEHASLADDRRSGTYRQLQKQQQQQGAMSHKCVHCGKVYSRRYGLTIHLRTHSGDKPLECPVCRRPFGDPSNLNKHVRLHAAAVASTASASSSTALENGGNRGALAALQAMRDSPYRCNHCGKVLVRRRDLERHIRSRHPGLVATGEQGRTAVVT